MTEMKYEKPQIATVRVEDLLVQLGPARATIYTGGDDDENSDDETWG
jgi:hypothetical protein